MQPIHVIDVYHGDEPVDFHAMKSAGVVGVIIKATQGSTITDPKFLDYHQRASTVFDTGCVHTYHFLDNSDPKAQASNYLTTTAGKPGRWLDFERNPNGDTCTVETACAVAHAIFGVTGRLPGIYGSDQDLLGEALDSGHFDTCPLWIAKYGNTPPKHHADLWQFAAGMPGDQTVGGKYYDLSTYKGSAEECKAWLQSLRV